MRSFSVPAIFLALASFSSAQGNPDTVAKIIQEGKNHSQVMGLLKQLTDIGPRLTSSHNLEQAQAWAATQLSDWGCTSVHFEEWGSFDVGFDRGPASGGMVAPFTASFEFTSPSWMEGTHGPLRGQVVRKPRSLQEFAQVKNKLKGAWVISDRFYKSPSITPAPDVSREEREKVDKMLEEASIAGNVLTSKSEIVQTFGNYRGKTADKHPMGRFVTIRRSDADRIQRNLDKGEKVEVEFNIPVTWRKGPVKLYNVVAEIKGTEKPDEVVIVGGHIDSWDGPGSQGALDNGTGTCTALEAARILQAVGAKPKRTIRFILWSGEEQGLMGSNAYAKAHAAEMPKISAVLVDDGGTNYQGGYIGPEIYKSIFETAYAPVVAAFPDMPEKYQVVKSIKMQETGSDHASFWKYGVPGFFTIEEGRSNYSLVHHTQFDRIDRAIPEYLVQSATNHAVVAYNLACLDSVLPRAK